MDITELQQRLTQLNHLLPSQREWLDRLLFQLAFNNHHQINVLGQAGGGKSTLALTVAELMSGHYNVALMDATVRETAVKEHLVQQWFGRSAQPQLSITDQIVVDEQQLPLVAVIDDAERFSSEFIQELGSLPCLVFCFSEQSLDGAALTLTLNPVTATDAAQLLQQEALNSIELAKRLANADGNLHLLLQPAMPEATSLVQDTPDGVAPSVSAGKNKLYALLAGALVVILLAYFMWPSDDAETLPQRFPVQQPLQQTVVADEKPADKEFAEVEEQASLADDESLVQAVETTTAAGTSNAEPASAADVLPEQIESEVIDGTQQAADSLADATVPSTALSDTADSQPYTYNEAELLAMQPEQLIVQLAVLSSDAALLRFKQTYPTLSTLAYQRNWQGKMQLVLILAPFESKNAARATLAGLPAALKASGPFTKTVKSVQSEINARKVSQSSGIQD